MSLLNSSKNLENQLEFLRPFILSRSGLVRHVLEYLVVITVMMTIVIVPLEMAFGLSDYVYFILFDYFCDFIFGYNILLSFLTSVEVDGLEDFTPWLCFQTYLTTNFWQDLFAAFPWPFIATVAGLDFYVPIRLLRLLRLVRLFTMQHSQVIVVRSTALKLIKLVMSVFSMAHWLGCTWLFISEVQEYPNNGFSAGSDFAEQPKWLQYARGFHWGMANLISMGGSAMPQLPLEIFLALCTMTAGMLVFASLISNINNVINDDSLIKHEEKMQALNDFFSHRGLPPELMERVRKYHEKMFELSHGFDENRLFEGLPNELRSQIARSMYKTALLQVPLFKDCDPGFLDALCTEVGPQICMPGDSIVRQGDVGFEMFFIASGVAEAETGKVFSRMSRGQFFGEIALFTLAPRSLSVIARTFMELYSLHKDSFARVLNYFPDEAIKFIKVAEDRMRHNQEQQTHQDCENDEEELTMEDETSNDPESESNEARLGAIKFDDSINDRTRALSLNIEEDEYDLFVMKRKRQSQASVDLTSSPASHPFSYIPKSQYTPSNSVLNPKPPLSPSTVNVPLSVRSPNASNFNFPSPNYNASITKATHRRTRSNASTDSTFSESLTIPFGINMGKRHSITTISSLDEASPMSKRRSSVNAESVTNSLLSASPTSVKRHSYTGSSFGLEISNVSTLASTLEANKKPQNMVSANMLSLPNSFSKSPGALISSNNPFGLSPKTGPLSVLPVSTSPSINLTPSPKIDLKNQKASPQTDNLKLNENELILSNIQSNIKQQSITSVPETRAIIYPEGSTVASITITSPVHNIPSVTLNDGFNAVNSNETNLANDSIKISASTTQNTLSVAKNVLEVKEASVKKLENPLRLKSSTEILTYDAFDESAEDCFDSNNNDDSEIGNPIDVSESSSTKKKHKIRRSLSHVATKLSPNVSSTASSAAAKTNLNDESKCEKSICGDDLNKKLTVSVDDHEKVSDNLTSKCDAFTISEVESVHEYEPLSARSPFSTKSSSSRKRSGGAETMAPKLSMPKLPALSKPPSITLSAPGSSPPLLQADLDNSNPIISTPRNKRALSLSIENLTKNTPSAFPYNTLARAPSAILESPPLGKLDPQKKLVKRASSANVLQLDSNVSTPRHLSDGSKQVQTPKNSNELENNLLEERIKNMTLSFQQQMATMQAELAVLKASKMP